MQKEFVRNPYNYDSEKLSDETGLLCRDESLTEQEHVEEADINYIAAKFMRTGELQEILNLPTTGDFEGIFDFQTAMNNITAAKQEFMRLPAKVRTRFDNDPAKLLEFVGSDDNYDEAVQLGFVPKKEKHEPATGSTTQSGTETTQGTTGTTINAQTPQTTKGA